MKRQISDVAQLACNTKHKACIYLSCTARANSPVLSVMNDAGDFLEPIGVVPVNKILAMVISRAEEVPQTIIAQLLNWQDVKYVILGMHTEVQ